MKYIINASDARSRFGEIIRRAKGGPVVIERDGQAEVVVLSKAHYDQLVRNAHQKDWRETLDRLHQRLGAELKGRALPDAAELIRQGRKNSDG